ncbi:hypothetical protein E6C50_09290 [Flavobacterium supellecticarium]|uniref:Uncharacterized protein n=1 Tax=Flavobacterium supellecticarium TaxID=2565924 RepID=A0A4S3ZXT7_9FLAO|nr:hypothetical protein [Flavobacterium supellecticarium]THF50413.1 hypothetical protein E6C50_09290 [Flavobacterium supellecticarium]
MATQIYELGWNDTPAGKFRLSTPEIVDYVRHFGQDTKELHEFLTRFDFEEWVCMELFVDYVYGRVDKSGEVGSDAVQYLSIVSGTFFTEEAELALHNYVGFNKNKFEYNYTGSPPFAPFPDCPLWIIQITSQKKQASSAIFFMPAIWWKDANMTSESYADSHFTVDWRGNKWYNGSFDKNQDRCTYWRNRIGSYAPNFIARESGAIIPFVYRDIHLDTFRNRVFIPDSRSEEMRYYDLSDFKTEHKTQNFLKNSELGFIESSAEGYRFYTDTKLLITDADFNMISESASKIVNSYEDDFWKVVLDNKGVWMTKKESAEEKRFKYSELKLTTSIYSNNPNSLTIYVNANRSVIFFGTQNLLSIVDTTFTVTNMSLDRLFKKEIAPYYYNNRQVRKFFALSAERQLLLTDTGVFELGSDEKPKLISQKLKEITGEVLFYSAVKDDALNGIWFVAGMDRLVFTDVNFEKGYVFNFTEQDLSDEHVNSYRWSQLFWDQDGDLWYSLFGQTLKKIARKELESKLKTAIAFGK